MVVEVPSGRKLGSSLWGKQGVPGLPRSLPPVLCSSCLLFVEFAQAVGVVSREDGERRNLAQLTPPPLSLLAHEHPTWGVGG